MKKENINILLVENSADYAELARHALAGSGEGYELEVVHVLAEARKWLRQHRTDVLVTALRLPDGNGLDLVKDYAGQACFPVVVVTGKGDEVAAAEAMRAGAIDFLSSSMQTYEVFAEHMDRIQREWSCFTRKQAMGNALLQSERKYRLLAASVKAVTWEFDLAQDRWTYVAPQAECMLGYPPEEWRDFTWWKERIPEKWREHTAGCRFLVSAEGGDYDMEFPFIHKTGSWVWLHMVVNVDLHEGIPVRLRGVMMDITARKRLEEENRRRARLERALGNAVNGMVTKVQEVLNNVKVSTRNVSIGGAQLCRAAQQLSPATAEQAASTDEIVDAADRAGQLLAELVPDIRKTAELIQEITAVSKEQAGGAD